jgi:hypothetical protein
MHCDCSLVSKVDGAGEQNDQDGWLHFRNARIEPHQSLPPMGAMREGQVLLVDDGSCPAGQIKRVVGGNHTKVGGTKQIVRTSSCVPR